MDQQIKMNEITGVWNFLSQIDWTDPWLRILIIFHILLTLVTILTRYRSNIQAFLFGVLLLLVYFSENINEIAAKNWRYFSRQQYFDSKGMFISFVFSVPLLINCLIMIANWVYQSTHLLIMVKRNQLKRQRKDESASNNVTNKDKTE